MSGSKRRTLIAGNWKMNGLRAGALALARDVAAIADGDGAAADLLICPPATVLAAVADAVAGSTVLVGGQDCHAAPHGAHTGDLSAPMLADAGASHVIVGHSERRHDHGEDDAAVLAKLAAAHDAGLVAVVCVGETLAERDAGDTLAVLSRQLDGSLRGADAGGTPVVTAANTVVAYEPVWAIGSGRTPTAEQVAAAHRHIRTHLNGLIGAAAAHVRLLYGGSVKPDNAAALLAIDDVDGALVGGASLDAAAFAAIAAAAPATR